MPLFAISDTARRRPHFHADMPSACRPFSFHACPLTLPSYRDAAIFRRHAVTIRRAMKRVIITPHFFFFDIFLLR